VIEISKETRTTNAIGDLGGAIEDMPHYAITIGMQEILASKVVRLAVMRDWHRAVVRRAACGNIDSAFPASLLQEHQDAKIYMNDIASERAF
jgi:glucosamine-6-phosphate deaminase